MKNNKLRNICPLLGSACLCVASVSAALAQPIPPEQLLEFSIEELSDLQITSASRRPESLSETASAIFVITADDIRRSGASTIPEALRLAPGLHVARIDSRRWAVSARGFNGEFANKLLVQIDGRRVYTPVHSGVDWDVQDVVLEDIERIEVIRGPGATQWGANAVNGVINIITRSAHETRGGFIAAGVGSEDQGLLAARWGDALGKYGSYRAYGRYFRRGESEMPGSGGAGDDWWQGRIGFRADWDLPGPDTFRLSGELYQAEVSRLFPAVASSLAETSRPEWRHNRNRGGNLLGRWTHRQSPRSEYSLQTYLDWMEANPLIADEQVVTFDIDFQHNLRPNGRHHVVWGLGYRRTRDDFDNEFTVAFQPSSRTTDLFSAFLQDTIRLTDSVSLNLGSKFEYNDYSGGEIQPSVRLAWMPDARHTVWGAVSRAVRMPSRAESNTVITVVQEGPTVLRFAGNPDLDVERLIAYELGYRVAPISSVYLDATIFYHDYEDLIDVEIGTPFVESEPPPEHVVVPARFVNRGEAESHGFELAARWQALRNWRLDLTYTYLDLEQRGPSGDSGGSNPKHQAGLFSRLDLSDTVQLDAWLRYMDRLAGYGIPDHTNLDLRVAWKVLPDIELSLVGQNLFDAERREFVGGTEIERAVYARVRHWF